MLSQSELPDGPQSEISVGPSGLGDKLKKLGQYYFHNTSFTLNVSNLSESWRNILNAAMSCGFIISSGNNAKCKTKGSFPEGGTVKIRIYVAPGRKYVVEFHKLEGCSVAFNYFYKAVKNIIVPSESDSESLDTYIRIKSLPAPLPAHLPEAPGPGRRRGHLFSHQAH